ncbi:uncharacterized protein LOC124348997 isoform X2 [Daphnia pulicaria]|uniref:uncharacterized protein LOC124348997 isoform X2 n=1 Tax=Daphnia pulicaria TaxID=35523 RepID=UPI001EE9C69A|nr:uncharacterized protein LOC124348997 isoform X2 [Daphnia pulicaria]
MIKSSSSGSCNSSWSPSSGMLKHLSTRQPTDHFRTPSNGLSESGQSDPIVEPPPPPRRLLTSNNNVVVMAPHPSHHHQLANGYSSPGRYSTAGSSGKQQQQPQLHNMSMHNTSKHSLSPTTSNISPGTGANQTKTTLTNLDHSRDESLPFNFSAGPLSSSIFITDRSLPIGDHTFLSTNGGGGLNKGVTANGGMHIRRGSPLPTSVTRLAAATRQVSASVIGVREMLTSLGLLCLLSLMMALLGLIFLLKMSPPPDAIHFLDQVRIVSPDEAHSVYEVSLALCSLAMTLDVCCCLVCATQLLFAARLITASTCSSSNSSRDRIKKFLRDSAVTRICAVAGFFVSIPVFLTDIVLYTIIQFPSTPAITTSIVISVGIVLCGCAMLHNIVVWQRYKGSNSGSMLPDLSGIEKHPDATHGRIMSPAQMPTATLDLSALNGNVSSHMLELSTLV